MNRPSTASSTRRPREKKKKAYQRLGNLYNMNSTSSFPKTKGGIIKRPTTAPNRRNKMAKLKTQEIQEKEKHRYSYWRHDTSILTKQTMLNNVNPSPRDPKADERSRRRKLHDQSWKMGRSNKLSSSRSGPPKVEVDGRTGEVRILPPEPKGWPLDNSMRNSWGPKPGVDPWQKPLDSMPPGDWPKDKWSAPSPRGMHHPWSPPRHGSSTREPLLGDPDNIRSKGTRKSVLSNSTPMEYLNMKEKTATQKRRPTTAAPTRGRQNSNGGGKVQFMSSVRAARDSESPMRGRMNPRQKKKRPQSAAPSPARSKRRGSGSGGGGGGGDGGGGNTSSTPSNRRVQQTTPTRAKSSSGIRQEHQQQHSSGGRRPVTAGATRNRTSRMPSSISTPNLKQRMNSTSTSKRRPHTASASSPMRSTYDSSSYGSTTQSPGGNRPHTAHAGGHRSGIRRSASAGGLGNKHFRNTGGGGGSGKPQPKYLRPTTATRTKRLYRTGQWPSGRWKYEQASHFVPMSHEERKKTFHVKHKSTAKQHDDPDIISSSSEDEEDEDQQILSEDAMKATRRARRKKDAQLRKRPMVAGQRKPRRRFEQKSLAHFTVLRSAPLKKHHVHLVLGKKLQERNRRCDGREVATSWILAHPRFKQMKLARFWKQFKPLALENIEATKLLQRLRKSAAVAAGDYGGDGDDRPHDVSVDRSMNGSINDETVDENGVHVVAVPQVSQGFNPIGMQVADRTPWLNEHKEHPFMWITRPQFIHQMRILMSLNETHNNLRALNRLFSSFDVDVEDKMNGREFCVVLAELKEERKRSVWAGKSDVNPVFEDAKKKYRQKGSDQMRGRMDHF